MWAILPKDKTMASHQKLASLSKTSGIFYPEEKLAVFVDGASLFISSKSLGFDIDYRKLLRWISEQGRLVRAFYYTVLLEDQEVNSIRPLVDWLDYNGFTMLTKSSKEYVDSQGRRRIKGNIDVDLAIDMLDMAERVDHIVLFSGEGDFKRLIEAVQRKGVRVTLIGTISTQPSMVADELRRQADQFIDLNDLKSAFERQGTAAMHPTRSDDTSTTYIRT
jgi:uncharacterized LabA/DUF88 family protein